MSEVEDLDKVFVFSEEDVLSNDDKDVDWELSCASQVEITDIDKENDKSQIVSICTSQIEIIPEEDEDGEGDCWKKKYENEQVLRKKEKKARERAQKNLKYARGCCCDLRMKLRDEKKRRLEKEEVIRKITVLSQENI